MTVHRVPSGVELYGLARPVQPGGDTPVNRWLAQLQVLRWPDGLRQCPLPAPLDHPAAALLPIYSPSDALAGCWAMALSADGGQVQQFVLGDPPAGSSVRLNASASRYMAVMAEVPAALTAWSRHGGTIWCPEWPSRLPQVEIHGVVVVAAAVAWATAGRDEDIADAKALQDRLIKASPAGGPRRQVFAVPPAGVDMLLPGHPAGVSEPARPQAEGPPARPPEDDGPSGPAGHPWDRDQGLIG